MEKSVIQIKTRRFDQRAIIVAALALTAALPAPADTGLPFDYRDGGWAQAWVETPASSAPQRTFTLPTFYSEALVTGTANISPTSNLALSPAGSFTITLNKLPTLMANSGASAAFDRAKSFWESQFVDPINVVIDADLESLAPNVLGETSVFGIQQFGDVGFNGVVDRMIADQRAQVGVGDITDRLPNSTQAPFRVFSFPPFIDFSIGGLSLSTANGKALGISGILPDQTDATIKFNSNFSFDFDRSDGIAPGTFDFEGIAIHEIGHALGFVSEVDTADFLMATSPLPFSGTLFPTPLDLFRLSPGDGDIDFTGSLRIMSPSFFGLFGEQASYFGPGQEFLMSEGAIFGDGAQASHWKDGLGIGIMDPNFMSGELGLFTFADLRAFDVIGWDLAPAIVPIPTALWLFAGGLLTVAVRIRPRSAW